MAVKVDKNTSEKLNVLSITASIIVVMIHATNVNMGDFANKSNISNSFLELIEGYFTLGINRIAVPLFFMISGYLFFKDIYNKLSIKQYLSKVKKRIFSLLLPFIIWSCIGTIFYLILQYIPGVNYSFSDNRLIKEMNMYEIIYMIIFNPIPYQLWFIRELFIYTVVSPIIFFLMKYLSKISLIVISLLWLFNINLPFIDKRGLLFFIIGSYLAIKGKKIFIRINKKIEYASLLIYLVFPIIKLSYLNNVIVFNIIDNIIIISGLISIPYIYDSFLVRIKNIALKFHNLSFFIFLMHEPILSCFRIVLVKFSNGNTILLLISYFISIISTVLTIGILTKIFKDKVPFIYNILSGGRIK